MALNLYGETNYELIEPLSFSYNRTVAIQAYSETADLVSQYRYTRKATKTYKFKGLSEKALSACLTAKTIQYTRRFMEWRFYAQYWRNPYELYKSPTPRLSPPPYTDLVATFNVSRGAAPVYDLQITVNETVAIYDTEKYEPTTLSGVQHIETLISTKTPYTGPRPLWVSYQGDAYYKSYAYEFNYDENLSGDILVP